MSSALDQWIAAHPYLKNLAEFQQAVTAAFPVKTAAAAPAMDWNKVLDEYRKGASLLENPAANLDFARSAGELLTEATERFPEAGLAEPVAASLRALREYLEQRSAVERGQAILWVAGLSEAEPPSAGLLRVLGWVAICRALAPVLQGYSELRKEEEWRRGYCPVCGAPPAMAEVCGAEPRRLACGCCRTLWEYQRIGCPFCGNEEQDRLPIFTIEQEPLFRLDSCGECHGYLKTYLGADELALHLSDWSTVHLDVVAAENQLQRKAIALFAI
jgi:FdhE protein